MIWKTYTKTRNLSICNNDNLCEFDENLEVTPIAFIVPDFDLSSCASENLKLTLLYSFNLC